MPSWAEVVTIISLGMVVLAAVRAMQRAAVQLEEITDRFPKPEDRDLTEDVTPRDPGMDTKVIHRHLKERAKQAREPR